MVIHTTIQVTKKTLQLMKTMKVHPNQSYEEQIINWIVKERENAL